MAVQYILGDYKAKRYYTITQAARLLRITRVVVVLFLLLVSLTACMPALHRAAWKGDVTAFQALLATGVDPDEQYNRMTPLMIGAEAGHVGVVKALLARGADVNAQDDVGQTALQYAQQKLIEVSSPPGHRVPGESLEFEDSDQKALRLVNALRYREIVELLKTVQEAERLLRVERMTSAARRTMPEPPVDVDVPPPARTAVKSNAYAVVIGIERYGDLPPADYAVRDAQIMKEYLIRVMGYPEENIRLLTNEQATRARVESLFETWLLNKRPMGPVFVYYSGHGAPDPQTGEPYLVPSDGDPGDVVRTAYPLTRLAKALALLPAREVIVVVDACFSGRPGTRSVIAKGIKPMVITAETPWATLGKKGVVFSAGDQISTVYHEKRHGLLTYFLLKGLKEKVEKEEREVTARALFEYLRPHVIITAQRSNIVQEPSFWSGQELSGEREPLVLVTTP